MHPRQTEAHGSLQSILERLPKQILWPPVAPLSKADAQVVATGGREYAPHASCLALDTACKLSLPSMPRSNRDKKRRQSFHNLARNTRLSSCCNFQLQG